MLKSSRSAIVPPNREVENVPTDSQENRARGVKIQVILWSSQMVLTSPHCTIGSVCPCNERNSNLQYAGRFIFKLFHVETTWHSEIERSVSRSCICCYCEGSSICDFIDNPLRFVWQFIQSQVLQERKEEKREHHCRGKGPSWSSKQERDFRECKKQQ